NRRGDAEHTSFDFLGYTFRGRQARSQHGYFVSFSPAMSTKAKKAKGQQSEPGTSTVAADGPIRPRRGINPQVRRWINYYGAFYRSELYPRTAHRRAPRRLGHAKVQAAPRQALAGMGMVGEGTVRHHKPKLFAH